MSRVSVITDHVLYVASTSSQYNFQNHSKMPTLRLISESASLLREAPAMLESYKSATHPSTAEKNYQPISEDIGSIIRRLCTQNGVGIIEAAAILDHIHRYVAISP